MLACGTGVFGFGFIVTADTAITYLTDCYPEVSYPYYIPPSSAGGGWFVPESDVQILGDALIAVVLIRNGISMIIKFAFTPWIRGMGIQNTFVLAAMVALVTLLMPIPLMVWGKRARVRTARKYRRYALRQPGQEVGAW